MHMHNHAILAQAFMLSFLNLFLNNSAQQGGEQCAWPTTQATTSLYLHHPSLPFILEEFQRGTCAAATLHRIWDLAGGSNCS